MEQAEQIEKLKEALRAVITSHCSNERLFCGSCTPARTLLAELGSPIPPRPVYCERCGGLKPAGQSCGCFDNGGQ